MARPSITSNHQCLYPDEIVTMQKDIAVLKSETSNMKVDVKEIKDDVKNISQKLDNFISNADTRYVLKTEMKSIRENIANNTSNIQRITEWIAKWSAPIAIVCYTVLKGFNLL